MNKISTIITYLNTFLAGVAIGISICLFPMVVNHSHPDKGNNPTNVVETLQAETNRATTTTYKVDWFKDSSNYIWDGWKIK